MIIYATTACIDDVHTTIIVAADSKDNLDKWWGSEDTSEIVEGLYETDAMDHLFIAEIKSFKSPVYLISHPSKEDQDTFLLRAEIEKLGPYRAKDMQKYMFDDMAEEVEEDPTLTIGQITNTDKHDPWDRTPSKHNMSVMSGAPKNITGDTSLGSGTLKRTVEQDFDDKQKKVLKNAQKEYSDIVNDTISTDFPIDAMKELLSKMEKAGDLDKAVADLIREKLPRGVTNDAKVGKQATAAMRTRLGNLNKVALTEDDDEVSVGIIGKHQDEHGNVEITARVHTKEDKKKMKEWKDEAAMEEAEEQRKIREAAADVGLDADDPDTVTALNHDGTVIQQNKRLGVQTSIFPGGAKAVQDLYSGKELDEKDVRKRELQAELKDLDDGDEADDADTKADKTTSDTPKDYLFAAVKADPKDAASVDHFIILRRDFWEKNKKLDDSGEYPTWLASLGFTEVADSCFAFSVNDIDKGRNVLLVNGLEESPKILKKKRLIKNYPWEANKLRKPAEKKEDEDKPDPTTFYFAMLPPGFHSDDVTTVMGQEAYVVIVPKKAFDEDGKVPLKDGGWFTEKQLDVYKWDEVEPSVFMAEGSVGTIYKMMVEQGVTENGLLLVAMDCDLTDIPFDWPYHYKKSGSRKSYNDMLTEATRILEIARKMGIKLEDEQGEITATVAGVDEEKIAAEQEQEDVTGEMQKIIDSA